MINEKGLHKFDVIKYTKWCMVCAIGILGADGVNRLFDTDCSICLGHKR